MVSLAVLASLGMLSPPAFATYFGYNGKIAYTAIADKGTAAARTAVFVSGADISHPVARSSVTNDNDSSPAWSPDGRKLAFLRRNGANNELEIWVVDPDGSHPLKVGGEFNAQGQPTPIRGAVVTSLTWTPDGERIGLLRRLSGASTLYTLRADGSFSFGVTTFGYGNFWSDSLGFDWGEDGALVPCSPPTGAPHTLFCLSNPFGGGGNANAIGSTAINPAEGGVSEGILTSTPRSMSAVVSDQLQRRAMFTVTYSKPNGGSTISFKGVFSILPHRNAQGLPFLGTQLIRHTPNEEVVSCSQTVQGVVITSFHPQYEYANPVPSPDGLYFLVKRTEYVPSRSGPAGGCSFAARNEGLYVLRSTGALQYMLTDDTAATGAAWQPSAANVRITVEDRGGNELRGLKVTLHDPVTDAELVNHKATNPNGGVYLFDDVPAGQYRARVALTDVESQPPAFNIQHGWTAGGPGEPAYLERKFAVDAASDQTDVPFFFSSDDGLLAGFAPVVASNVPESSYSRLHEMAAIYYQVRRFVDWVKGTLVRDTQDTVEYYTFAQAGPGGAIDPADASYRDAETAVWLGTETSGLSERNYGDQKVPLPEWHEFAHHLTHIGVHSADCVDSINHFGYGNSTTCDSLDEGFAMFMAAAFADSPFYRGIANLEDHTKAWNVRSGLLPLAPPLGVRLLSDEDVAVAGLLWDMFDAASSFDAEHTEVLALPANRQHAPVTYTDDYTLPVAEIWRIFTAAHPVTVYQLRKALDADPIYGALTLDLDSDGLKDVSSIDQLFLMHGFFPILEDQVIDAAHNTYHYSVSTARATGKDTPNFYVGMSSHFAAATTGEFLGREDKPADPKANVRFTVHDSNGAPIDGAHVELTLQSRGSSSTLVRQISRGDQLVHLELPLPFDYLLPPGGALPPCDPLTSSKYVSVTVEATVNGFVSSDAPLFDSCTYQQAVTNAAGAAALSLEMRFPADSAAPVTTPTKSATGQVLGVYTSGTWIVALACNDPAVGGFASGCNGTEVGLDGAPFAPYAQALLIAAPGLHTVAFRSRDRAGNLEPAGSIQLGVVDGPLDTRAPVTVLDKKASVGTSFDTTMGTWTLRFSCNDLAQPGALPSGCARTEYWINGSAHLEATAPVVLSAVGTYRVSYRSLDLMGNAEDETIEFLRIVPATDQDGDGVLDQEDNCMLAPNANLRDTDGDGFGNRCDPDFNQNVTVDSNDASLLKSKLGTPAALSPNLDLDGNGLIDLADMSILQSMFRKPPGPSGLGLFP